MDDPVFIEDLLDIVTPVAAAIEAVAIGDDDDAIDAHVGDIADVMDQLDKLLNEIEVANDEDNAEIDELHDIIRDQQVQLAKFESFVDSIAKQHQTANDSSCPEN